MASKKTIWPFAILVAQAEFLDKEDICIKCWRITALERTMAMQQRTLTELEHIVMSLSKCTAAEGE